MLAPVLPLALLFASAAPSPTRVMLMPLVNGEGVTESTADAVTDAVAGELRRIPGLQVITRKEVSAVLSFDRQKALVGCQSDSCLAELGGALDADRLVTGNVARLGESWILRLQVVDARKVTTLASSDRRKKGGNIDDVLDAIPTMVRELQPGLPSGTTATATTATPEPAPAAPPTTPTPTPKKSLAPRWADEPVDRSTLKGEFAVVTDGKGRYLAFAPFADMESPLFAGDGRTFYAQRVFGHGSEPGRSFSYNFWEPRARVPAEAAFEFKDGVYTLVCGRQQTTYKALPKAQARELLKKAKLLEPRWRRRAYALARDDEGTYFYVDQARAPEGNTDLQLYIGETGSVVPVDTRVLANDLEGDVLGTPDGKLRLAHGRREAEWIQGQARRPLKYLLVESHADLIYAKLGAYKGEALGTPCDGAF